MEFVPVKAAPGILFCRWETRVKDFEPFCEDTDRAHEGPAFPQGDDHPVVNVSYNDAMEFCAWLSEKEGKKYRLPKDRILAAEYQAVWDLGAKLVTGAELGKDFTIDDLQNRGFDAVLVARRSTGMCFAASCGTNCGNLRYATFAALV